MKEFFMQRCFELALLSKGYNSPNPKVGAVVVYENRIIGEGFHQMYGKAHAEVNAINSVEDKSLLKHSTIYVNLEPCCHYGKTPPCAQLLINSQIKRCVIANKDSNPKVDGGGIAMLSRAGIEVECGVLEKEGRFLNRRFFCNQEKKRPYIILKYAQSLDGFMDVKREKNNSSLQSYWITNNALKVWVHEQRMQEDAILVGYNTVLNDNPNLTTRHVDGKNPIRVVIDKDLSLPKTSNIFNNLSPTLIFNYKKEDKENKNEYIVLEDKQEVEEQVFNTLYKKNIGSIIIEGGRKTINHLLEKNLWDEAYVLTGNTIFKEGVKSPVIASKYLANSKLVSNNRVDYFLND
ncbi:MAG: bifunctional diaminohydroxyphosphoribosylaminopyrimidine deaminase/5-amino-6-(5-phosphoribosylamino)uracil reductase RibD [Bacteroidota bacterium]|nr:bifunctional diaminohydroxyphosphoribosylaminopyrimidine deaminase/5-amino-6-(5-phosphoribosylamino)uracil reductase RibD [Bacteroidota bacterium]